MNGFQVTFFTHQGRRHAHQAIQDWLMHALSTHDIHGATLTVGAESYGRSGKFHSKDFVELADEPLEVTAAMTDAQATALFEFLEKEQVDLFFIKSPIEYGFLGAPRDEGAQDPASANSDSAS